MVRSFSLALVALLATSCASGTADKGDTAPPAVAAAGSTACDEVVAGIDAFNLGQFDETVRHFEAAVPLAEEEAETDDSSRAADLLDAVRYYADLPAEDYLEASKSSPEFAKFKTITLGQCGPVAGDEAPGQLA